MEQLAGMESSYDNMLAEQFVGKHIHEIQTPAAILDVAVIKRNCTRMLETTRALGVQFRAHVKTHKVNSMQ
jgi:D-serine deaminase-like pyridoxal phosphate-dependent protein